VLGAERAAQLQDVLSLAVPVRMTQMLQKQVLTAF